MGRSRPYHPRARDAQERGIIATGLSRSIALAEMERDRIASNLKSITSRLDAARAMGQDVSDLEIRVAGLRVTLAEKSLGLDAARRAMGQGRAA